MINKTRLLRDEHLYILSRENSKMHLFKILLSILICSCVNIIKCKGSTGRVRDNNVMKVPHSCPSGTFWFKGRCRRFKSGVQEFSASQVREKYVIMVPHNCPSGSFWFKGRCRAIKSGVQEFSTGGVRDNYEILVHHNCPTGSFWFKRRCRPIK